MSGVTGKKLGRKYSALLRVGELVDVLHQLPARGLPGEVGVGLREAELGQLAHHRAARERLREEDHVAVDLVDLLDQPLPEQERLRVRVVDAVDLHAGVDPEQEDPQPLVPEAAPVLALPVDVVDVLVLLGRVLGVLERPVRAAVEPLGMVGQPRVVGGRVDREVHADVHAVLARGGAQGADVVDRAEVGVDGVVAALLAADGVGRAGVAGAGHERVVAALAVGDADRVDRGHVDHVEAHRGELGHDRLDALDPAPGAREDLVPGAEAPAHAVDLQRQRLLQARRRRGGPASAPSRRRARARARPPSGSAGSRRRRRARSGRGRSRACPARPWASRARAARRPRTARRRGPPARRRPCAGSRRARWRRGRSRPRPRTPRSPGSRPGSSPPSGRRCGGRRSACISASSQLRPPGAR